MSEIYDKLIDTAIMMDDELGEQKLPNCAGVTNEVVINGKKYTIRLTIEEAE